MKHYIIGLFGASGVGKTYAQHYLQKYLNVKPIITHTTRKPRPNEKNGIDYHFDSIKSFKKLDLMESTEFNHNFYGSAMNDLKTNWKTHKVLSIVLDYKGISAYIKRIPKNIIPIYLFSNEDLVINRLKHRGDSLSDIKNRLNEHQKDLNSIYKVIFNKSVPAYKVDTTNFKLEKSALKHILKESL